MRAYAFNGHGGPEREAFVELDQPLPGAGEILVKVHAAGVNPADWKRRSGRTAVGKADRPVGLGREVAGVVEAVGEGVAGFAAGEPVLGQVADGPYGAFASHALVLASWTVRKPPAVSFLDAAALPIAAATAFDGIEQLALHPSDTLVVIGAGGGVGIAACQFARQRGARVIGVASLAKKELVESTGAVHVEPVQDDAGPVAAAAPEGVAAAFDLVGGEALLAIGSLVAEKERIVTTADEATVAQLGGSRVARRRTAEVLEAIVAMTADGAFDPHVTQVFPFEQAGQAIRIVESGHAAGKIVLEMA